MITQSGGIDLAGGLLLALIATTAMAEAKSSSLVPKSLLLWPALVILFGVASLIEGWQIYGFSVTVIFGAILILCGIQAALVNLRRLSPWPSGAIWLGLVLAGIGFQLYPLFEQHIMGFLWFAIGITKVVRERSASLEAGIPTWILLLYVQAILLASYR